MASLNKENVNAGDTVYDLVNGYGKVLDTTFNEIAVRFDSGIRVSYTKDGCYGGVRRLFWHNPIIVDPPKCKNMWEALIGCVAHLYNYFNK